MLQRVITGAAIAVVVLVMLFSNALVTGAFVTLLALVAQYEFLKVVGIGDKPILLCANMIFSALFAGLVMFGKNEILPAIIAIYAILLFAIMLFNHEKIEFMHVSLCVFSLVYITASMLHIITTRKLDMGNLYIFLIFSAGSNCRSSSLSTEIYRICEAL
jgi:CDP-diglyceride synthetase